MLDRTWFAWIGETDPAGVFYYRDSQPRRPDRVRSSGAREPEAVREGSERAEPEHIHIVVRTPNGNDYGKDLLRQHYLQHPHTTAQQ